MAGEIFSESWHRVAGLRLGLRPALQIRKQLFRGERWYVLQDAFDNKFYRFRPAAYRFLARLTPGRTVQEAWDDCLRHSPDDAPTQPEVISLLGQLYQSNLLQSELPPDSAKLLERREKQARKRLTGFWLNVFFLKLPVCDPDAFLKACVRPLRFLVTPWAGMVWLLVVLLGLKVVAGNMDGLREAGDSVFAPDNLLLLYLTFIVTKAVHEFGHAFLCRAFGGEVHQLGFMLILFNPMPFVDATSSWAFRSRLQRILVASGGMIFELFLAALATFVWASTAPGPLNRFASNVMFIASVSTVLFNINPLIRFDGYYILSDLLDVPNMANRAVQELKFAFEHWICGVRNAVSTTNSRRERSWLIVFAIGSGIYRIILGLTITLHVGNRFFELGLLLGLLFFVLWLVVPIVKFALYITTDPVLQRTRSRAVGITGAATVAALLFIGLFPFPQAFRAPGVAEARHFGTLYAQTGGFIQQVLLPSASPVATGTPLVELANPELDLDLASAYAQKRELLALREAALSGSPVSIEPLAKRLSALEKKLQMLLEQKKGLTVLAPRNGTWVAPENGEWPGAWVERGSALGEVVDNSSFRFSAVVSQTEAASLFRTSIPGVEVRFPGESGKPVAASIERIVPAQQEDLPASALGWRAGGDIQVEPADPTGRRTSEPFFLVIASLHPADGSATLLHHRRGQIRFQLEPAPLAEQWWRKILQLLQKRYRV